MGVPARYYLFAQMMKKPWILVNMTDAEGFQTLSVWPHDAGIPARAHVVADSGFTPGPGCMKTRAALLGSPEAP